MMTRRSRCNLVMLMALAAVGSSLSTGCVPANVTALESFTWDLLLNALAALLL